MLILIENGEVYAPEPQGRQPVLLVTANTASALKLAGKGRLEPGKDADLLVLRKDSLEIVEVIARGRRLVKGGKLSVQEKVAETSSRELHLVGEK
jgi:adenine deaminase